MKKKSIVSVIIIITGVVGLFFMACEISDSDSTLLEPNLAYPKPVFVFPSNGETNVPTFNALLKRNCEGDENDPNGYHSFYMRIDYNGMLPPDLMRELFVLQRKSNAEKIKLTPDSPKLSMSPTIRVMAFTCKALSYNTVYEIKSLGQTVSTFTTRLSE